MSVYDPINLETLPINDFINNAVNNIVIIYDNKAYGVNKSMLMFNNEMKKCIIENNALLKKTTYDNKETFFNIGFFFNKKIVVDLKTLNSILKKKNTIFELTSKQSGHVYINKELLELTTIGLLKKGKNSISKVNFKHTYEDVYFDELISNVLNAYSGILYKYINTCLLEPDLYNSNDPLDPYSIYSMKLNLKINVVKKMDVKIEIDKEIEKIDKAFIEAAPRFEKKYKTQVFYRGMKVRYKNTSGNELYNVGEKAHILNFTSITSSFSVAKSFAGYGPTSKIYKILIDEGIPYINMVSNTKFKHEKEYLLPRNIIFELIDKTNNEYTLLAKAFKPDQFNIKTGCIPLDFYDIVPSSIKITKEPKFIFMDLGKKHYVKNNTDISAYTKDLESKYKGDTSIQKHFILLVGKPGAGKSYFIKHNLKQKVGLDEDNFINLNPDDLRYYNKDFVNEISGFLTKKSSNGENYIVNGKTLMCYPNVDGNIVANMNATVNTLEHIQVAMQNYILPSFMNSNKNIIYDSSCNDASHCGNLLNNAMKKGYKVSIICVDAPTNIAFDRAKERQKSDGRFMSDDYLNSIYSTFDIEKNKNNIIKYSGIPVSDYYKIIDNNTKSVPKEDIIPPKLKRCPNGTIRNKVTKECVPKGSNSIKPVSPANPANPVNLANPVSKPKLGRCPNGTRRNKITLLCEPKP
jgi:predicted ABC-type ATPase/predicted transcriptional regulator